MDVTKLPKEDIVKIILASGAKEYSMEVLENDIKLGLPINDDGTINMFDYMAWLYDERYLLRNRGK
jgi:hypothetical protein